MELIDKKGKINKTTFKQLVKSGQLTDKIELFKDGQLLASSTLENMLVDLFQLVIENSTDIELAFVCNDMKVLFTGKDYNWFLKGERLIDVAEYAYDLNDAPVKQPEPKPVVQEVEMHVAISDLDDSGELIIEDFKGNKSDCIKWLNQQIVKHATIDNEVNALFCLDFEKEEQDWKTLKELFDEGKIDIC